MQPSERLMTPGEVAELFRVDPKTVTRWAAAGRINSIRTPGGHRRFRESEVQRLLRSLSEVADSADSGANGPSDPDNRGDGGAQADTSSADGDVVNHGIATPT